MLSSTEAEVQQLFDRVIDAYVSAAEYAVMADITLDEGIDDEMYDEPEYKYEISRINTKAEEWKKELFGILNGNTG